MQRRQIHFDVFQPNEAEAILRLNPGQLTRRGTTGAKKGPPFLSADAENRRQIYAGVDLRLWARSRRNFITPSGVYQCRPNVTNPMTTPDMITEAEAAAILRLKPDTLRQWRNRRKKGHKKGPPYFQPHAHGQVLYARSDLDAWIKKHRVDPASEK
jgi:hypothetical protein